MAFGALVLIPPLLVIVLASITRRLNRSLFAGIVTAVIIAQKGNLIGSFQLLASRFIQQISSFDNLYLYGFLISTGTLIVMLETTGSAQAFAHLITNRVKTKKTIESSSIFLSLCLFIDDYLSILTTGHVMRPIAFRYGIPPAKLAFLIHALAGSVVILAPVSSWVAAITAQLNQAGVDSNNGIYTKILVDPFYLYLCTLPFMFYSFLIISSTIFIVRTGISFGPIGILEQSTQPHHNTSNTLPLSQSSIIPLILPIITLISFVLIGIPLTGGYYLFGGNHSFLESFQHNQYTFLVLLLASITALTLSVLYALYQHLITIPTIPILMHNGFALMRSSIIMVIFASILAVLMREDLATGAYIASLISSAIPIALIPFIAFIVSLACGIATGSAWGTFAIMLAIGIQTVVALLGLKTAVTPDAIPILLPTLGAIFSGGVCGNLVSPVSETTAMAATSVGITSHEHAYTQLAYTIPVIGCTMLAFIFAGYLRDYTPLLNAFISLSTNMIICFGILYALNQRKNT